MKKFENELGQLRKELVEMGELTEAMVAHAVEALAHPDKETYDEIMAEEERLDQMQLRIDHEAVRLLTVYGPVAADLRFVLSVSHVNTALERIGDQAVNICDDLKLAKTANENGALAAKLQRMGEMVKSMVHDALTAFERQDPDLARTTIGHDDLVDSLKDQVVAELLSDQALRDVITGPGDIAGALSQILLARAIERMADQAVNICQETVFMVQGDDIRHSHAEPTAKS